MRSIMKVNFARAITPTIIGLFVLFLLLGSVYTVEEGHVGIVKRWSKAVDQVGPGLHVKIPIADSIERIEVRQRKNVEDLAAATKNQLPTTATVSINWTVNRNSAMDLFIHYGGLDQFETRILDPKLRSAAKAAIARFQADELIRNRQAAVAAIMEGMALELEGFPVTVNSPQIENLSLPNAYLQAVEEKEKAREDAEKEKHKLDQQRLIAQQAVNSAEANAEAKRLEADAEAYRVLTEAQAEADAIRLINEQLGRSPLYVDLVRAKRWDGVLPQTVLGEGVGAFLSLPPPLATTSTDDTK
ncbi:MAG: prohibitin family protein [Boseongicola sp. SB0677_bin_26]|nr:prohibitin family protein [Boseongicola sp. SB0665_bin_10]MYG24975.1 prohibitin family protein [Boseongicola sp. SB0677_bin_26]